MQARLSCSAAEEEEHRGLHGQTDVKCCNVGAGVVVLCGGHRQTRQGVFICYLTSTLPWAWRYSWDKGRPLAEPRVPERAVHMPISCRVSSQQPPGPRLHAPSWTRKFDIFFPTVRSPTPCSGAVSQGLPPPCSTP